MLYETPDKIAQALAKHIPIRIHSILDPAVGNGALLSPIIRRISKQLNEITCVDINKNVVRNLKVRSNHLKKNTKFYAIQGDFLKLAAMRDSRLSKYFDCIVMNPPFSAKRKEWVKVVMPESKGIRAMPIEAAFLIHALGLLKPYGRLLVILPPSIVSAASTAWLRLYLQKKGSVLYVHELPTFSFMGVESRMYLFVYEKTAKRNQVLLLNHDLTQPEKLIMSTKKLGQDFRLDFSYQHGKAYKQKLIESCDNMGWLPLQNFADVYRGTEESPMGGGYAFHTSDYKDGFWRISDRHKIVNARIVVRRGDLLIKRVGRKCSLSVGKIIGSKSVACTDCVMIIRPQKEVLANDLLMKLRVSLTADWGRKLVERGTGASYVTKNELSELKIPSRLNKNFRKTYEKYCKAVSKYKFGEMLKLEKYIQSRLSKRLVLSEYFE